MQFCESMNGKGAAQVLSNVMIKPYDKTSFIQMHYSEMLNKEKL